MHFLKGKIFVPPKKTSHLYNSKIISGKNLKFSLVDFGYKIISYTNFPQNHKCSGQGLW